MQQSNVKLPKHVKERKDVNQYEKALLSDRNMRLRTIHRWNIGQY